MKKLRRVIKNILMENVLSKDVIFNVSDDNIYKYGKGIFYMYNPDNQSFDMDDNFFPKNRYGSSRGDIHGFASHSFKHFKEFTSASHVEDIFKSVIEKLRELGYDKVLVQKNPRKGIQETLYDMSIDDPNFRNYIMNGLDWIQDRVQKGWNVFPDEIDVLDVAMDIHGVYAKALESFLNESKDAVDISDKNFPNKQDLFEYLVDCYKKRKAVIFKINREGGKIYQVLYNIGDTRYTSFNEEKNTRGTFMRMEKDRKRRSFWRNIIRWAPISKIDDEGAESINTNVITAEYSNFAEICQDARFNKKGTVFELGTDKKQTPLHPQFGHKLRTKNKKPTGAMIPDQEDLTMEATLRRTIQKILVEKYKVRGYIKPTNAFHSLGAWEQIVNMFLRYQRMGIDTRSGEEFPIELSMLVQSFFPMLDTEVKRYEQFTKRNAMHFIEDFVNHRFWSLRRQFQSYVPDIDILKFAYFYSRGDIEPYVLLDENWTMSIYGSLDIQKEVKHYTSEEGLQNLIESIESGSPFDISTFTTQHKTYFDPESTLCVTLLGNVRAAFRSDIKSFATTSGRRAMNLLRLDYPGEDTNICYDLDDCEPNQTQLWNEMIVTPTQIIKVDPA